MLSTVRNNLTQIVQIIKGHGIPVILLTTPSLLHAGLTHKELEKIRFPRDYFPATDFTAQGLLLLSERYVEVVRTVARAYNICLVDLARFFELNNKDEYFTDQVHLTDDDNTLVAEKIAEVIGDRFVK